MAWRTERCRAADRATPAWIWLRGCPDARTAWSPLACAWHTAAAGEDGTLLTIPGYGDLTTRCIADAGAEIFFDAGSRPVELVAEQQANDSSLAEVFRKALTASGGFSFVIAGGNANEVWDHLMLRYGTVSSPTSRVTEHVAAVSVFYAQLDPNTCDFDASVTASNGFKSP